MNIMSMILKAKIKSIHIVKFPVIKTIMMPLLIKNCNTMQVIQQQTIKRIKTK